MKNSCKKFVMFVVFFAQLFLSKVAFSTQYVLEWDSVADERLTGYTVYYGEAHRDYDKSVDVGMSRIYIFSDLDPGIIYYFAVKANYGSLGESDFSSEVTSGLQRYAIGLGADPNKSGKLEILNLDRTFEQDVAIGWADYNVLSGEARIATGDIDGDGKDEIVLGFAPVSQSGLPAGRFEILDDDFTHLLWGQVSWPEYNILNGETRPAIGDLDGDGREEIFVGLGHGGDGLIEIFHFDNGILSSFGWTEVNWPDYCQDNGESWPALGDVDGDGRDEMAIGLGSGGSGAFVLKRGFNAGRLSAGDDPWDNEIEGSLQWAEYSDLVGETRPSFGDLNGDGNQEIVVGLGKSGGGYVEIFDYLSSSLIYTASVGLDWPEYNASVGETRPIIGDVDGDQRGEVIVGLGKGGGGFLEIFDDEQLQFIKLDSLQLGTIAYQDANGSLWPSVKKERINSGKPVVNYLLTVDKDGLGSGAVGGGGSYPAGTNVTPVANAASGSILSGWSPGTCGGSFAITANTTCKATFTLLKFTMTVSLSSGGSVTSEPTGISCGSDCTEAYMSGTSVSLTAVPATGYGFYGWTGACTGIGPCTVNMTSAKSITATFKLLPKYRLSVTRRGSGKIVSSPVGVSCGSDCSEAFVSGSSVTLTATPASRYRFSGWSGACTGTGTCVLTMSSSKSVTGTFVK